MQRKTIATLAAAASLAATVFFPIAASARGGHGGMGGSYGGTRMMTAGHAAGGHFGPRAGNYGRFAFHNRFAFGHRFAFRHHFRHGFFFAGAPWIAGDGCVQLEHVWTDWGWTWRRVWVCD